MITRCGKQSSECWATSCLSLGRSPRRGVGAHAAANRSLWETVERVLGNIVPLPGTESKAWGRCSRCGKPLNVTWIPLLWLWCVPSASGSSAVARAFNITPLLWFLPTLALGMFLGALTLWATSLPAAVGLAAAVSLVMVLLGLGLG